MVGDFVARRLAKIHHVDFVILTSIMQSNREHLIPGARQADAVGKRQIGFVGLSFKRAATTCVNSLVTLAEQPIGKGVRLAVYELQPV